MAKKKQTKLEDVPVPEAAPIVAPEPPTQPIPGITLDMGFDTFKEIYESLGPEALYGELQRELAIRFSFETEEQKLKREDQIRINAQEQREHDQLMAKQKRWDFQDTCKIAISRFFVYVFACTITAGICAVGYIKIPEIIAYNNQVKATELQACEDGDKMHCQLAIDTESHPFWSTEGQADVVAFVNELKDAYQLKTGQPISAK